MSETPPTRKVVRRVVRKPVAVPGQDPSARAGAPPATDPGTPPADTVVVAPPADAPTTPTAPAAPRGRSRLQRAAAGAGRTVGAAGSAASRVVRAGRARVGGWRLPAWSPLVWCSVVGGGLGLLVTGAGVAARALFSAVRGVSTGGGTWGTLALALICLGALVLGEVALRALRVPQPRATSLTGVLLVLIAVLAFFLDLAATAWAWLLLPALGAAAYALAHRLLAPAPQDAA